MPTYLMVAQILVALALIAVILVQVHGGGLGGIFGQADTVYRTRRGVEKSLMRFTIALVVVLIILSFWAAKIKS